MLLIFRYEKRIGGSNSDADMDMTNDNEAAASTGSDASTELFDSEPPLDARDVDGEDDDATGPEHTTNNEFAQVCFRF